MVVRVILHYINDAFFCFWAGGGGGRGGSNVCAFNNKAKLIVELKLKAQI